MWQTAKSLVGKASIQPPRKIIFEGKIITSLKTISGLINEFYIQKIKKIRDNFRTHNVAPIDILKKLISKPKSTFSLKSPSVAKV